MRATPFQHPPPPQTPPLHFQLPSNNHSSDSNQLAFINYQQPAPFDYYSAPHIHQHPPSNYQSYQPVPANFQLQPNHYQPSPHFQPPANVSSANSNSLTYNPAQHEQQVEYRTQTQPLQHAQSHYTISLQVESVPYQPVQQSLYSSAQFKRQHVHASSLPSYSPLHTSSVHSIPPHELAVPYIPPQTMNVPDTRAQAMSVPCASSQATSRNVPYTLPQATSSPYELSASFDRSTYMSSLQHPTLLQQHHPHSQSVYTSTAHTQAALNTSPQQLLSSSSQLLPAFHQLPPSQMPEMTLQGVPSSSHLQLQTPSSSSHSTPYPPRISFSSQPYCSPVPLSQPVINVLPSPQQSVSVQPPSLYPPNIIASHAFPTQRCIIADQSTHSSHHDIGEHHRDSQYNQSRCRSRSRSRSRSRDRVRHGSKKRMRSQSRSTENHVTEFDYRDSSGGRSKSRYRHRSRDDDHSRLSSCSPRNDIYCRIPQQTRSAIVLDAANIAMSYGLDKCFQTKGIALAKEQLESAGYDVRAVISARPPRNHSIDRPDLIEQWRQERWLTVVDASSHDDDTCIALARELNCPLVSRDAYRLEVCKREPEESAKLKLWLKHNRYQFRWSKDTFLIIPPNANSNFYTA